MITVVKRSLFCLLVFATVFLNLRDLGAQKVTLDQTSQLGPALTYHDGKLFMAWAGRDFKKDGKMGGKLNVMRSSEGIDWRAKITLDEKSEHPPSLTSFNDKLYMAWTGRDSKLNIMRSEDGIDWRAKIILDDKSELEPAIIALDDNIYLLWRGRDDKINILRSDDGIDWRAKVTMSEKTKDRPTMTSYDGRLYIAWTGVVMKK